MAKLDFLAALTAAMRRQPENKQYNSVEVNNGKPMPRDVALSKLRYLLFDLAVDAGISTDSTGKTLDTMIFGSDH